MLVMILPVYSVYHAIYNLCDHFEDLTYIFSCNCDFQLCKDTHNNSHIENLTLHILEMHLQPKSGHANSMLISSVGFSVGLNYL